MQNFNNYLFYIYFEVHSKYIELSLNLLLILPQNNTMNKTLNTQYLTSVNHIINKSNITPEKSFNKALKC